jgi:hypothetical protein
MVEAGLKPSISETLYCTEVSIRKLSLLAHEVRRLSGSAIEVQLEGNRGLIPGTHSGQLIVRPRRDRTPRRLVSYARSRNCRRSECRVTSSQKRPPAAAYFASLFRWGWRGDSTHSAHPAFPCQHT